MGLTSTKNQYDATGPILLHWPQTLRLVDNQFYEFCRINKELRIERTSAGDCEIMAPTGGETSWRNSRLITLLSIWADREGSDVVFDSSGGFILSNGAIRSPDVSWIKKSRLAILTAEQKQRFYHCVQISLSSYCPQVIVCLLCKRKCTNTLKMG